MFPWDTYTAAVPARPAHGQHLHHSLTLGTICYESMSARALWRARLTALSNGVRRTGMARLAESSLTIVSFLSPSMSGWAIEAGTGVTKLTQYAESRGVRTGTPIITGRLPRIDAVRTIISR